MRLLLLAVSAGVMLGQTVAISAGGIGAVMDGDLMYSADRYYSGGTTYVALAPGAGKQYTTQRYGNFVYELPAADGVWELTLGFYELASGVSSAGQRVFKVNVNGVDELPALDIWAVASGRGPWTWTKRLTVKSGSVRVQFTTVVKNAVVSSLLLRRVGDVPAPVSSLRERVETFRIAEPAQRVFSPADVPAPGTLVSVYLNGVRQTLDFDYVSTPAGLVFVPLAGADGESAVPVAGDVVTLHYWTPEGGVTGSVLRRVP